LPVGSKTADNDQAAKSYRLLARKGFRDFIYAYVGYNPSGESSIAGYRENRLPVAFGRLWLFLASPFFPCAGIAGDVFLHMVVSQRHRRAHA